MPVGQLIASQLYDVYDVHRLWACGHRRMDVQVALSLPVQKPSDLRRPMALACGMGRGAFDA